MDLKSLSRDELLKRTGELVREERRITTEVLWHLFEIERRRLFAELGFSSLFEYCVKSLKYSESASYRRISAMRLLKEIPEVEHKISSGELSVSAACQLQSFFKEEKTFTLEQKKDLIEKVQGKSKRECERVLVSISPRAVTKDSTRPLTSTQTEVTFVADDELMELLARIKDLTGKTDYASLLKFMATKVLKQIDPVARKAEARTVAQKSGIQNAQGQELQSRIPGCQNALAPAEVRTDTNCRYIPAAIKKQVWIRDQGTCRYVDPVTKRRCESRFRLEIDHCKPFALEGTNSANNLRLLCRAHNQLYAVQTFGRQKIESFIPGLTGSSS